jgi:iron-sulfur cluster assembly accessory protein
MSCSTNTKTPEKKNIHRQMTIEQILSMFPTKAQRLSQEITNAGLHCVGCHAATWETLEVGMYGHGKKDDEINHLVKKLNDLLEEKDDSDPKTITLTKKASAKFIEIAAAEGKQGWGIRFGDRMAGCNGFEYVLDFAEKADPDDVVFESNGIQIYVKKDIVARLLGCVIDYVDGITSGFKVTNSRVKSTCGCGTSHNY